MRRILLIGAAVAAGFAVATMVASNSQGQERSERKNSEAEELRVDVTPEMERHSRIRNVLYFAGTAWLWGALGALVATPLLIVAHRLCSRMVGSPPAPPQRLLGASRSTAA